MAEHHIKVTRTARYFTLGEISEQLKEVWFVCHGQAQLANYFLKGFEQLKNEQRLFVAPEALSRFYTDQMAGRVGAIWMTSEDRLSEIDDYVSYLNQVGKEVLCQIKHDVKVHVLGFSQGVATVCRWVASNQIHVDQLTLWAGNIPPELDFNQLKNVFDKIKINLVVGNQDEFAAWIKVEKEAEKLATHSIAYKLYTFEGGHKLNSEVLQEIAN